MTIFNIQLSWKHFAEKLTAGNKHRNRILKHNAVLININIDGTGNNNQIIQESK